MFFREFDISLKEIKAVIENPVLEKKQILQMQRKMLVAKKERMERLITSIDRILKGDNTMMDFEVFNKTELEDVHNSMVDNMSEEQKSIFIEHYGSMEEWKKKFLEDASTEAAQKNFRKIVEWYGSKDKVIEACDKLDVELKITGEGREYKNLKKLSPKPVFTGRLEHTKVLEEMRNANIFVLPSINETFGMVYLEAMASGCITVCSENDGIAGIIKDGVNGYFWRDDIIEKILNSDNQNQILENSYKTIINYTREKACENYLNQIS